MSWKNIHNPRFLAWLYSLTHNYFWLDCPKCGRKFGGQESADISIYSGGGSGWGVCWRCGEQYAEEIQEQNDKIWKSEGVTAIDGRKL